MEIIGARKDGTEFAAEVSLSHIVFENIDRVIAFVSDITARRVMEREARRNETLNALGAVAGAIAHELNNPLAVISSRIELMLSEAHDLPSEPAMICASCSATSNTRAGSRAICLRLRVSVRPRAFRWISMDRSSRS